MRRVMVTIQLTAPVAMPPACEFYMCQSCERGLRREDFYKLTVRWSYQTGELVDEAVCNDCAREQSAARRDMRSRRW